MPSSPFISSVAAAVAIASIAVALSAGSAAATKRDHYGLRKAYPYHRSHLAHRHLYAYAPGYRRGLCWLPADRCDNNYRIQN